MPRFDGTGPRGAGSMTGRGEGYCVLAMRESGEPVRGYAGVAGVPVGAPTREETSEAEAVRWAAPGVGRGRSWAGRRWRGRWLRRG